MLVYRALGGMDTLSGVPVGTLVLTVSPYWAATPKSGKMSFVRSNGTAENFMAETSVGRESGFASHRRSSGRAVSI